jgi:hypothetical protein
MKSEINEFIQERKRIVESCDLTNFLGSPYPVKLSQKIIDKLKLIPAKSWKGRVVIGDDNNYYKITRDVINELLSAENTAYDDFYHIKKEIVEKTVFLKLYDKIKRFVLKWKNICKLYVKKELV